MILTAGNLFHYLRDRGFATAAMVVDGDWRVTDLSRRNQAFRVGFRSRPGFVVKQVGDWRVPNVQTFEAEAHWYWLARHSADFAPMSRFLSGCAGYDAENQVLILDVPEGCEDLDRFHRRSERFSVEIAQLLGETLAAFHTALPASVVQALRPDFRESKPWVLSWHQARMVEAPDSSNKGAMELLEIVREDPVFGHAFEEMRAQWQPETFINGDMKLAHCILHQGAIYFIDWELADFGDPLWDAGAILQEYLWEWLRSMPASPRVPLADAVRQARRPLEEIQPAIRGFWQSYVAGRGVDGASMLDRAMGYAAAWLIQNAYQTLHDAKQITARAVRMAQVSRNILADRTAAIRGLLAC